MRTCPNCHQKFPDEAVFYERANEGIVCGHCHERFEAEEAALQEAADADAFAPPKKRKPLRGGIE